MKRILVIVIGVSVFGLFFFYVVAPALRSDKNTPATGFASLLAPAGTREYKSMLFRFSLFYPKDLQVKADDYEGSATTIVFENAEGNKGFQIFIVPYKENQISAERFKMDVPSGVIKDKSDILIGGAPATMFYSTNAVMGDTREVWFIKNGFLYEVTTYKELDAWLSGIMQTWRFLEF